MQDKIADLTSDSAPLVRFLNMPSAEADKKNETTAELTKADEQDDDEDFEAVEAAKKAQEKLDQQSKRYGSKTFPPTKIPLLVSRFVHAPFLTGFALTILVAPQDSNQGAR